MNNLPQPPNSYYCWQLKLFIEAASTRICHKENSNVRPKLIPFLFASSIEMTCDSVIQNWEKSKKLIFKFINKLINKLYTLHIYCYS